VPIAAGRGLRLDFDSPLCRRHCAGPQSPGLWCV